jgi:uncharacterized protein (TIGR02145 family)
MKKETKIRITSSAIIGILIIIAISCKKSKDQNIFIPTEKGTVTDIDGNVYKTVKIGNQWWMAENLKTTKYNDGTSIPLVINNTAWVNKATSGYCWYYNDTSYKNIYGALYNWYTVNTGKLAPAGWHIPTDAEWCTITQFLDPTVDCGVNRRTGKDIACQMKEAGTTHWYQNTCATNSS